MTMFDFEVREINDENIIARDYQKNYHEYPIMKYWDEEFGTFVRKNFFEGVRVLDLGCGPASLWDQWLKYPHIGKLVGVDISDQMVEEAKKRFPDSEFVTGRAHKIPYPEGSFDVVIASSVLHHIPDSHLAGAINEISRVLDEHGVLIGREPVEGQAKGQSGWFTGALMYFRHLLYRLTKTREISEQELGDHHHAYDPSGFLNTVSESMYLDAFESRFPVSNYISRIKQPGFAEIARELDEKAANQLGSMFHYRANKNYASSNDVSRCVEQVLIENNQKPDKEFLAYLQSAAEGIEKIFSDKEK